MQAWAHCLSLGGCLSQVHSELGQTTPEQDTRQFHSVWLEAPHFSLGSVPKTA